MRKSYLFIIMFALLAVSQMAAQDYDYIPFVREGVKWVCMYRSPYDENVAGLPISKGDHYYTLELKGDSVINGHTYKAMHLYSGESINVDQDTVPVYLREENKVVYAIIPDDKRYAECPVGIECMVTDQKFSSPVQTGVEYILYDFNNPELFYAYADCYDYTDTVLFHALRAVHVRSSRDNNAFARSGKFTRPRENKRGLAACSGHTDHRMLGQSDLQCVCYSFLLASEIP